MNTNTNGKADDRKLKTLLAQARSPSERVEILRQSCAESWLQDPTGTRPHLERLLTEAQSLGDTRSVAAAASKLAEICRRAGQPEQSRHHAEMLLEIARTTGYVEAEVSGLHSLGLLHQDNGNYDQAGSCYQRCLELSTSAGYLVGQQAALNQLGSLDGLRGLPEAALEHYRRCLGVDRQQGDIYGQALTHGNIGWALEQTGRWEEAAENFYRSLALSEEYHYEDLRLNAMANLGELFLKRNKLEHATSTYSDIASSGSVREHFPAMLRMALTNLGLAQFRAGNYGAARKAYAESEKLCTRAGDRRTLAAVCWRRAELELVQGRHVRSAELIGRTLEIAAELNLRLEKGEALRVRALLLDEQGDSEGARNSFEQALATFAETGDGYELAHARLRFGHWLVDQGEKDAAIPLLREAVATLGRLSVVAESERAYRILFGVEASASPEPALLDGLTGLAGVGLEPVAFFERALRLVTRGLGYDSGAVLLGDQPVAVRNDPDVESARSLQLTGEESISGRELSLPLRYQNRLLGTLYLARSEPGARPSRELLQNIERLLAEPISKLAELPGRFGPERIEVPGVTYQGVIGRSPLMLKNLDLVSRVASTNVPVLVRGESGTGKELVARALHDSGVRRTKPFVAVNCAAVPETLLEAEFFGVEKGAATGVAQRRGKFELANGGTVFLDEVGDMSPALQAKLLRVLQEKTVEHVGGDRSIKIDIRIVAATNMDLEERMLDGQFREDLFYRLNTVELSVPPLRERREDIPDFVRYFITRSSQEYGRNVTDASREAMRCFVGFDWPGNIRQLQGVVERAVILARGEVLEAEDLPPELRESRPDRAAPAESTLRDARRQARMHATAENEKAMVVECLQKAGQNTTKAAELAGYSRAQFYRLMRRHGIRMHPPDSAR